MPMKSCPRAGYALVAAVARSWPLRVKIPPARWVEEAVEKETAPVEAVDAAEARVWSWRVRYSASRRSARSEVGFSTIL